MTETSTPSVCRFCNGWLSAHAGPYCPHCGRRCDAETTSIPWESATRDNWFGPLKDTVKAVLSNPSQFYRDMPLTGGIVRPMLFAGIVGTVATWATLIVIMGVIALALALGLTLSGQRGIMWFPMLFLPMQLVFQAVVTPMQVLAGLFFLSGILHVSQLILRLGRRGFEATFRAVCYGYAPMALMLIPILGWLVAPVWQVIAVIIGLREVNRTTTGRAALAYFLPMLAVCGVCGVTFVIMGIIMTLVRFSTAVAG